ncbi:MAG: uncharacterized protein K0S27_307 [Gammaproteobacteria bacterium]|jgi:ribosome-associated protein|nr:uncharacterized protein [Gammaproteobacteria bacterium]
MQNNVPPRDSKSERKRQMIALQKIGEILVTLPAAQLLKIPLNEVLLEAITVARSLTSHNAKRRQLQYIGRLMRDVEDIASIQTALDKFALKSQQSKAKFHQIERWRDKLVEEQDATLDQFLQQFPDVDRQHLRQLIRNAKKNSLPDKELFRYLQNVIDT